jgi:hypothetical protein
MTREEAIAKLNDISTWSDTEAAHYAADDIICELLSELGFADVEKWYA